MPGLRNAPAEASLLAAPGGKLKAEANPDGVVVELTKEAPTPPCTVVVLKVPGAPEIR